MSRKKTVRDFQFGSRLGEGSYSQVFKGVDTTSRKVFAIKVLSKKHIVKEKKIKYVNIEKITLNRLGRHPGIVTLYYTFQDDNSLYFVIDLAEHGELLTLIRKLGSLSETCSKYYMIQLIDAVDFMHKKGVIHRDLKPENILLNGDMKLMITDFGAAKILDLDDQGKVIENEEAFAKGSFVGTAEYVSPELLKHNKCGFESDLWAIGCILYQFIVGVPPFKGKTEYATFEKIVNLQYQWPNYFIPEVVKDIVSKLLKSNPGDRLTISELEQHPWFSRLNWEDKTKIWGLSPPRMDQYRPLVEQQLQQNTTQMNKIMIQKKLPAATVKKQLLSNTINQIRGDAGNNYLYNGLPKESPRKNQPPQLQSQFAPPVRPVNGMNGSPTSSSQNPISPQGPRILKQPNMSPHQRPQISTQQQFTPPRVPFPGQAPSQSPTQQRPPISQPMPQPRPFAQSPSSQNGSPVHTRPTPPNFAQGPQQQSPTRLKAPVMIRPREGSAHSSGSSQSDVKLQMPPSPPIAKIRSTPTSSPAVAVSGEGIARDLKVDSAGTSTLASVTTRTLPQVKPRPATKPVPQVAQSTPQVNLPLKSAAPKAKAPTVSSPAQNARVQPTPVPPLPVKNPGALESKVEVKAQQIPPKPISKPPQISLPPKPKSQASKPPLPKLQPPSIVTNSVPVAKSPVVKKPLASPASSPRISSHSRTLQSKGAVKGPTEIIRRLAKDEEIVKLDFIDFAELDFASLRTFDPSSSLSQLSPNLGLDDVLIHEIITRNKYRLEDGTKRVVLVITDHGNLFLFESANLQSLTYLMGIDLTDKMFAMYDYEFSEHEQSGYLILEVLKMDKLVFLSPLKKQVKADLMEISTIQQGMDLTWIDALMKTKELLKKKGTSSPGKTTPSSSTPSPKTTSSTRGTTPTNTSSTSSLTVAPRPRVASTTSTSSKSHITVKKNTSTNGKKPRTPQQVQQQNRKFAGGAAAAAFKSAR